MKGKRTLMLAALLGGAIAASGARAHPETAEHLGTPAPGTAARVVIIDAGTSVIKAGYLETLAIQNRKGQRFVWRFEPLHAPTGFPLKTIAPADFDAGDTWVYVGPSPTPRPQ